MFASCTGFVRCLAVEAARVIFGGIRMRWRVGEYWLSLRDLTKLNIGHRQRRDDPTDVWPPPAATSWDQCLVHPKNSICSKANHYGHQNANYLLHVSGGCARTPATNNDWGYPVLGLQSCTFCFVSTWA